MKPRESKMGISFRVVQYFQNAGVREVYKANQVKSDNNAVSTDAKTCAAELRCYPVYGSILS